MAAETNRRSSLRLLLPHTGGIPVVIKGSFLFSACVMKNFFLSSGCLTK